MRSWQSPREKRCDVEPPTVHAIRGTRADVGALAGGAVVAADPAQRGAALALYALSGFTTGMGGIDR
jgi:hypothetical protein